jgi:hypothetical protein
MKPSSVRHKPISRAAARNAALVNQLATPGLGSLMARRIFAGICQLLLAVAGFVLIVGWMGAFFWRILQEQQGGPVAHSSLDWLWPWGPVLFGASWLWSLVTSISLLRQAKSEGVPPKLMDLTQPENHKSR